MGHCSFITPLNFEVFEQFSLVTGACIEHSQNTSITNKSVNKLETSQDTMSLGHIQLTCTESDDHKEFRRWFIVKSKHLTYVKSKISTFAITN